MGVKLQKIVRDLRSSLALISATNYYRFKPIVANLVITLRNQKMFVFFFKYAPDLKMFEMKVADFSGIYNLRHVVQLFYTSFVQSINYIRLMRIEIKFTRQILL
jgi:hypothetical protein